MTRFSRRRVLIIAGTVTGVAGFSRLVSGDSVLAPTPSLAERLGPASDGVGAELIALGDEVNVRSPQSGPRVSALIEQHPDVPVALILVDATRGSKPEIVAIDGWQLPDLVAGVAGNLAVDAA